MYDVDIREFFDRLEEASFTFQDLNAETPSEELQDFRIFRAQCEARELAGRERFGREYLTRDNCIEATEEAADLANYAMFDVFQARHYNAEEDWSIALTAAQHAAKAHRYARALRGRHYEQYSDSES